MNRYTVTNLLTGNVYKAEFATQAAFDEWLERKSQVKPKVSAGFKERRFPADDQGFGSGWSIVDIDGELCYQTEEIIPEEGDPIPATDRPLSEVHPDWYATGTPTLDGDEVVVPAQHTIEIESLDSEIEAKRIEQLWDEANEIALQFDHNSRAKALSWKVDGSPQWRTDRIAAIDAWMDGIWSAYYAAVATPGATTIGEIPDIPYNFSDLIVE